jgi:translation initiation factor IF-2
MARVRRDGEVVTESRVESVKRFQDDVREVQTGFECGITIDGFEAFEPGDEIVTYHMEQVR